MKISPFPLFPSSLPHRSWYPNNVKPEYKYNMLYELGTFHDIKVTDCANILSLDSGWY